MPIRDPYIYSIIKLYKLHHLHSLQSDIVVFPYFTPLQAHGCKFLQNQPDIIAKIKIMVSDIDISERIRFKFQPIKTPNLSSLGHMLVQSIIS